MPKALPNFTLDDYRRMLAECKDTRSIAAILVVAMGAWAKKKINNICMASILHSAADAAERMI